MTGSEIKTKDAATNSILPKLLRLSMVSVCVTLLNSACSEPDPSASVPVEAGAEQSIAADADVSEVTANNADNSEDDNSEDGNASIDADSTAKNSPIIGPMDYDFQNWPTIEQRFELSDLDAMQSMFGKVEVTDENSLDYASNTAVKYRFTSGKDPYLDIIDSQDYLEFGWYYANPFDSDEEKETSTEHAKKVYKVAQALMGEEGGALVVDMLGGQIIKNRDVGGQRVALAKCEFYSCMLILEKKETVE